MWEEERHQHHNKLLITKKMSVSNVIFSVCSCSCTSSRFFHSLYSVLFTHLLLSWPPLHLLFCHSFLDIQQWSLIYWSSSSECSESLWHNSQQCSFFLLKWWCNPSLQQYSFIFWSLSSFICSDMCLGRWSYQVTFALWLVEEIHQW